MPLSPARCGRHCSKGSSNSNSFGLQNKALILLLRLFLFCGRRDRRRGSLPRVAWPVSVEPGLSLSSLAPASGSLKQLHVAAPAVG